MQYKSLLLITAFTLNFVLYRNLYLKVVSQKGDFLWYKMLKLKYIYRTTTFVNNLYLLEINVEIWKFYPNKWIY